MALRRLRPWSRAEGREVGVCFGCGFLVVVEKLTRVVVEWSRTWRRFEEFRGANRVSFERICGECAAKLRREGRLNILAWERRVVLDLEVVPGRWKVRRDRALCCKGYGLFKNWLLDETDEERRSA